MGLLDGVLGDSAEGSRNPGGLNMQGMLGGLLGRLGGGQGSANNAMLATVMALVQQQGGIEAIVRKFQAGGLSDVVSSWIGTGPNVPVSGSQVQQVLGPSTVSNVASTLGVDEAQASSSLATMLPELINQLTPHGKVEADSNDLLTQGLSMLRAR